MAFSQWIPLTNHFKANSVLFVHITKPVATILFELLLLWRNSAVYAVWKLRHVLYGIVKSGGNKRERSYIEYTLHSILCAMCIWMQLYGHGHGTTCGKCMHTEKWCGNFILFLSNWREHWNYGLAPSSLIKYIYVW